MRKPTSALFHARVGVEKGWLIKSYNWTGILEAKHDALHLRVLSPRGQLVRSSLLALGSVVTSALAIFAIWRSINSYFLATLPAWEYVIWAVVSIPIFLGVLWFLGIAGMLLLLDYLTLGIQARQSGEVAILGLREVRIGTFRHNVKVVVEKEILPLKVQGEEFLLTVAATRRGLKSALALFATTTSSTL